MARKRAYITGLSRLLAAHAQPVYVVDAQRTVVYCNPACIEWTGLAVDELIGRQCAYSSGHRDDGSFEPLSGLCPPLPGRVTVLALGGKSIPYLNR